MLEIKPVIRYAKPRYPDAEQALKNPDLLKRLPARFAAKPIVCAALGAVLSLGLAGCQSFTEPDPSLTPAAGGQGSGTRGGNPAGITIPVFVHGEGMGSYGCVSVAPPVFLSEEEAAEVIREEASKYGLDFSGDKTLENAQIPRHNTCPMQEEHTIPMNTAEGQLKLDGYDKATGIGFEFVSAGDLRNWPDPNQEIFSSVETYYFRDAAEALAAGNPNVAVFYDPASADYTEFDYEWPEADDSGAGYREYTEKYDAAQREKSKEDLRAQVRDFLEWLKGQGVI